MKVVEVRIAPELYHRAEALAAARQCSVEALLRCLIEQVIEAEAPADRTIGLFADEPDLIDNVLANALAERERRHILRSTAASRYRRSP